MINGNQFLLRCLKAYIVGDRPPREMVAQAIESPRGIEVSDRALTAVLDYLISSWGFQTQLPDSQKEQLRKYHHYVAANNAVFLNELNLFLEEAARENIRVLLLKGLALIKMGVYPEKGLRLLSDMDVFIKKDDISRVETMLDRAGWKIDNHESELHLSHHLPIRISPHGFPLEVHFALSRMSLNIDEDRVWKRVAPIRETPAALIPSLEDTLFALSLNVSLHHPDRVLPLYLKFVVDFAFMWKYAGGRLDWEYLADAVERSGANAPFWNAVVVAARLIEPPGLSETLTRFDVESKVDGDFVSMAASRILEGRWTGDLSWLVALAAEETSPMKRLYRTLQVVFPPRSFMAEAYPRWNRFPLIYLAYFVRLFKVAWNFDWKNFIMAYRAGKAVRSVGARRD